MAKIVLDPITSGYQSTSQVNNNNADIASNLNDQVLYRNNPQGEPNEMLNLLDMNSNRIINVPDAKDTAEPITFGQLLGILGELLGDSGSGEGGINLPFVTETVVLSAGQTQVSFASSINLSVFSISDTSADSHRLIQDADYSVNLVTRVITLFNSYPAGTVLQRYREQSAAEGETAEGFRDGAQEWAENAEDVPVSILAGGDGVTTFSSLHHSSKSEGFATDAELAPANEGFALYNAVSGAVALDATLGTTSIFKVVPNGNITDLSIINVPVDATRAYGATIIIQSDGSSTVTFNAMFVFVGGTPPTLSTTIGERDYVIGLSIDDGTTFDSEIGIAGIGP